MTDSKPTYLRSPEVVSRANCRLLIVDVQAKLVPLIPVAEALIANNRKLIAGAKALGIPTFATEQYPRGLGGTVPELAEHFETIPEKLRFSSAEVLAWGAAGDLTDGRHQVVIAGIEAHVCVHQTVQDLAEKGVEVHLCADAIGSRDPGNKAVALERAERTGAVPTTVEMALLELCGRAGTDEFKAIQGLIR